MYCCEMYVVYGAIIWFHMMVCSMRDITNEETEREKKEQITRQTVEVADKVVEIASLLGETAAETKIALAKLKESGTNECSLRRYRL